MSGTVCFLYMDRLARQPDVASLTRRAWYNPRAALHSKRCSVARRTVSYYPQKMQTNATTPEQLQPIRLVAMDVDGVLTDGSIVLGVTAAGDPIEAKSFNVKDGLGISLLLAAGLEVAWITGRVSPIVERRAAELGVREVVQWARNKRRSLTELSRRLGLSREQVLYLGDDLNDLPAFDAAGVSVAVADAVSEVRDRADWVTAAAGGRGAVREVAEELLRAQGRWQEALAAFLERLEREQDARPGQ